jgi:3',5'-cyclic AMP phosphodiesterase CpdA
MGETALYVGSVVTQRPAGERFTFALVSDTHIGADLAYSNQGDEATLAAVGNAIASASPDFFVNLGDMLDYHEYGFNAPPPASGIARQAYVNYRSTLGDLAGKASHYPVIGGWDSESGCNTAEEIDRSRSQRLLYLPAPRAETYPEGGSPFEDYYAFTWGDALFVVLNVFTYTPTCHLLSLDPGLPDDWTLGQTQLDWLRQTLANARSKWKILLIHHPVGGNAGDDADSAYGRGGGRAAHVGEQEIVHQMMRDYGVQIFFYGHDHVFTDMVVDGIHYSLPGSAGAIWMFTGDETGYDTFWPDSGWARVDVTPEDVHVQFLPLAGPPLFDYRVQ